MALRYSGSCRRKKVLKGYTELSFLLIIPSLDDFNGLISIKSEVSDQVVVTARSIVFNDEMMSGFRSSHTTSYSLIAGSFVSPYASSRSEVLFPSGSHHLPFGLDRDWNGMEDDQARLFWHVCQTD